MEQKDNITLGHMAGRDVNVTHVSNVPPTFMSRLEERFERERASNAEFAAVIEALQYYRVPIDEKPIGLERKLELGDRVAYIPEALRSKELFAKLMAKNNLYEASQRLFAYCLGQVEQLFTAHVVPRINRGVQQDEVDTALITEVIQPLLHTLEGNFLNLTAQDIKGMVYYLTANCFLWWHRKNSNANLPSGS